MAERAFMLTNEDAETLCKVAGGASYLETGTPLLERLHAFHTKRAATCPTCGSGDPHWREFQGVSYSQSALAKRHGEDPLHPAPCPDPFHKAPAHPVSVGIERVPVCAKKRCRRQATEAFDVWSWLKPQNVQTPKHYEVCEKHAAIFVGSFDRSASETVSAEYQEWEPAP